MLEPRVSALEEDLDEVESSEEEDEEEEKVGVDGLLAADWLSEQKAAD